MLVTICKTNVVCISPSKRDNYYTTILNFVSDFVHNVSNIYGK